MRAASTSKEITARPSERPPQSAEEYEAVAPEDLGYDWLNAATEARVSLDSELDSVENMLVDAEIGGALMSEHSLAFGKPLSSEDPGDDVARIEADGSRG